MNLLGLIGGSWLSEPPASIFFGRGMGSYYALVFTHFPPDYRFVSSERSFKHAHSEYVEILADGGLVALAGWLLFVSLCIVNCARVLRRTGASVTAKTAAASVLAGIAGMLVQALVGLELRTMAVRFMFTFLAGLSAAISTCATGHTEPAAAPARTQHLRLASRIVAAMAPLALCVPALLYGYRYFRSDVAFQSALRAEPGKERSLMEEALRWNPSNVYVLYERMIREPGNPPEALALAERIERLIPGYRRTTWIRGVVLAQTGNYREAALTLARHASYDSVESSTYFHLMASQIMASDTEGAPGTLRLLFESQHPWLMYRRYDYLDLEARSLRLDEAALLNRVVPGDDGPISVVSVAYLRTVVGLIAGKRSDGYHSTLVHLYVAAGGIFDELGYADVGLGYYDQAVRFGPLNPEMLEVIVGKNRAYCLRARAVRDSAIARGDIGAALRASGFMKRYLENAMRALPSDELRRELAVVEHETELLRARR